MRGFILDILYFVYYSIHSFLFIARIKVAHQQLLPLFKI